MTRADWLVQAQRLHQAQQPFALVTVLRTQTPISVKAGDKAIVTADGCIHGWIGGGCAQPTVIRTVRNALADGQPRMIRIAPSDESSERQLDDVLEFGMTCHSGGTLELFIDPMLPAPALTIVGDSSVARALSQLAPRVGLSVNIIAQDASIDAFPDAQQIIDADDPATVQAQLLRGGDVVVATQGRRDLQGLKAALALQPQSLWFVASAKKAAVLLESLKTSGEDAAAVDRIIAPAGASIGAQTPEEIALAVLTTVVATQRQRGRGDTTAAASAPTAATAAPTVEPLTQDATQAGMAAALAEKHSCCGDE